MKFSRLSQWVLIIALNFAGFVAPARAVEDGQHLINLEHYKPIYFVSGNPDTKIQLSFKAKILEGTNLYLGYSQLMMWELFSNNPYFRDLNYNPEIFHRVYFSGGTDRWLDIGAYEHESNGKGGDGERSWNRSYLRYHDRFKLWSAKVFWSFKLAYPYVFSYYNKDLPEYRGIWELEFTLEDFLGPFFHQADLTARLYPGGNLYINPLFGGQEITFRTKLRKALFLPVFVIQFFHGYGENLYNYKDNRYGLRFGIGL